MPIGEVQMMDQATGLRNMVRKKPVQVIAVTGGKGGIGKTNVSVNLSIALAAKGRRVLLMDADLGLSNVDILLGLQPKYNLSHVIDGQCALQDILIDVSPNLTVIPASSGKAFMTALSRSEHAGIIQAFSEFEDHLDVLIIDTAAGISESVTSFTCAAQEIITVVCDEPASLTDAYAQIKMLSRTYGIHRFKVLANMVSSAQPGRELFCKLSRATDQFLDVALDYVGSIPNDELVRKAIMKQRAVVDAHPRSKSATAFNLLADKAIQWPLPSVAGGHMEFFVERLIEAREADPEALL